MNTAIAPDAQSDEFGTLPNDSEESLAIINEWYMLELGGGETNRREGHQDINVRIEDLLSILSGYKTTSEPKDGNTCQD